MTERIIISRTDSIGDVVLTLPLAAALKSAYPGCTIIWFGRNYTLPVLRSSMWVDEVIDFSDWEKLDEPARVLALKAIQADSIVHVFPRKIIARAAAKAGIQKRIGTSHRPYHWFTCNRLINLGRKNSDLHEAQLNLKLLSAYPIRVKELQEFTSDDFGLRPLVPVPDAYLNRLKGPEFNLVLHPLSQGSAREWSLNAYTRLIQALPESSFRIWITGTRAEGDRMQNFLEENQSRIIDLTGKLSLDELIAFLSAADGLVAASTGPLHLAAALGKKCLGIYPPIRPTHAGRWGPLGEHADSLTAERNCELCRKSPSACSCMNLVEPEQVLKKMMAWL